MTNWITQAREAHQGRMPTETESLLADLDHRARYWRQPGIGEFPPKDLAADFAQELERAAAALRAAGVAAVDPLNDRSRNSDDRLRDAPLGTRAPADMGGAWCKTECGWKWNGPNGSGGTFPRPGGDWTGKLVPEQQWLDAHPHHARTYGVAAVGGQTFPQQTPTGDKAQP